MMPIRAFMSATRSPGIRRCASVIGYSDHVLLHRLLSFASPRHSEQNTTMLKISAALPYRPHHAGVPGPPAPPGRTLPGPHADHPCAVRASVLPIVAGL